MGAVMIMGDYKPMAVAIARELLGSGTSARLAPYGYSSSRRCPTTPFAIASRDVRVPLPG